MKRTPLGFTLLGAILLAACGAPPQSSETRTADRANETRPTQPALPSPGETPPERMSLAQPVGKMTLPVDVRYQLAGTPVRDQPTTLELALVPRVSGQNLHVEFPESDSVTIESGGAPFRQQKVTAATAVRRSLVITPRTRDAGELRVIISMDAEGGRYFGIYSIPFGAGPMSGESGPNTR